MPVTPFHFGPGAAIHALAPRHVSFLAFCGANVLIDVEPLYFMLTAQPPMHRMLHTYLGATIPVLATLGLFLVARTSAPRLGLPDWFGWSALTMRQVALGAAFGGTRTSCWIA